MINNLKLKIKLATACCLLVAALCFLLPAYVYAIDKEPQARHNTSLNDLKNEVLSYFKPLTGKIISVDGISVKIDKGAQRFIRAGMRLYAFKEGVSFVHPITKEPLGKMKIPVGSIEITTTNATESTGVIIKGKPEDFVGAKIKIPATKIRILFYQGDVNWFLGDSYYQKLKESGRFELIDTGIETEDISEIVLEAKEKEAEAALVLRSENFTDHINLTQKLFWISDSKQFSERTVKVDIAYVKDMRFESRLFEVKAAEALLSFQLPFGASRLAVGDLDGGNNSDIIVASGDDIKIYRPGAELQLLQKFKIPSTSEVLWLDTIDTTKNKKDEILITSIYDGDVTSHIYELRGSEFVQLWKSENTFIRKLGSEIIGQKYTDGEGYDGSVFSIIYAEGVYSRGENLKLPANINIYDFQFVRLPRDFVHRNSLSANSLDEPLAILAWDDNGYLNFYNEKGVRIWASKEDFGGFLMKFKRESIGIFDRGEWSVKDRLVIRGSEILAPKRKPLLGMAKGLGYSFSEIRSFWWDGFSVEERALLEEIDGEILDYALAGDKVVVLSKPIFGIRARNILKGENPFGVMLHIFSLKWI